LTDIEADANVEWWNITEILEAALEAAGKAVATTLTTAAKAVAAAAPSLVLGLWPLWVLVGVAVYFLYFRKGTI
jgi:hypothetical protein